MSSRLKQKRGIISNDHSNGVEGFRSAIELGSRPDILSRRIVECGVAEQLQRTSRHGILGYSEYIGYDGGRLSCEQGFEAFQRCTGCTMGKVRFVRGCDNGHVQQQVLTHLSRVQDDASSCVFHDLLDRLPRNCIDWIDALVADSFDDDPEGTNVAIENYLVQNNGGDLKADSMSWCVVHQRYCPLFPVWAWRAQRDGRQAMVLDLSKRVAICGEFNTQKKGRRQLNRSFSHSNPEDRSCRPWWQESRLHQGLHRSSETENTEAPLCLSISGVKCTAFTPRGKQKRLADSTDKFHSIWIATAKIAAKLGLSDVDVVESAAQYPPVQKLRQPLSDTHSMHAVRSGPHVGGFPTVRMRTLVAAINRSRCVWTGPSTDEAVQNDFDVFFCRTMHLTGDVYGVASATDIRHMVETMASGRKQILPEGFENQPMENYIHKLLPPWMLNIKSEFNDGQRQHVELRETCIANICQHLEHGSAMKMLPPMDTTMIRNMTTKMVLMIFLDDESPTSLCTALHGFGPKCDDS